MMLIPFSLCVPNRAARNGNYLKRLQIPREPGSLPVSVNRWWPQAADKDPGSRGITFYFNKLFSVAAWPGTQT
jgi:hypothetical protein